MTIRAVIFDYGNVLARTLNPEPRALWEQHLGLPPGDLQRLVHNDASWIAAQHGYLTPEAHWHDVATRLNLSSTATAALRTAFYQGDVVNAALVARIDDLRTAGIRVALLSNFSAELRDLLHTQELVRHFDHIAISAEIGVMKPDAAAYQTVLDLLDVPAGTCIFIDDVPANVKAARLLGLRGIVFRDTHTCLAQLSRLLL